MSEIILAINPGSTSTKIAVYDGEKLVFESNIHHSNEELARFETIVDQFTYRKEAIITEVEHHGVKLLEINCVVGRGGLTHPVSSGVYGVNEQMQKDLRNSPIGHHASNLGGLVAKDIARDISELTARKVEAYIADPVVVDEMDEVARIAGHPLFERKSVFHALNQKAVGRLYAKKAGRKYDELNLVVAHLGGGISIGAHSKGRVVDVNNTLDGEGPMTPERAGTLPVGDLAKLCFAGKYTLKEVSKMIKGEGGFVAHLATNDTLEVLGRARKGDAQAAAVLDALCYNVAKYIGAMATVLCGEVDAVIITGGMAYSEVITSNIARRVQFIAPVEIYAGQHEMQALASGALAVLRNEIEAKTYAPRQK